MKKTLLLLLVLSIFTLSACSTANPTTTAAPTTASTQEVAATAITDPVATKASIVELTNWIGWANPTGLPEWNQIDTKIGKLVAELTGIAFRNVYAGDDAETAFNLKLASGTWEDVITTGKNNAWNEKLLDAGVIEALDSYYEQPDKYPALAVVPKEVKDNARFTDGKIYYFTDGWNEDDNSMFATLWCASGWYLFPEYLAAVNMTEEDLATIEGIEAFLLAVKDAGLKNAEGQTVMPMTSSANLSYKGTILTTFGVSTAINGFDLYDGKVMNYRELPKTKEAFAWMNKLQREGLMDPEYATQTNDMLVEKLMAKRVAMIPDMAWGFWTAVTGGKTAVTDLIYIPFPKVPGVDKIGTARVSGPYGSGGWMMTVNCRDKEAVAKAADWGNTKGQHRYWTVLYGPVGTLWQWSAKGEPYFELIDPEMIEAFKNNDTKTIFGDFGYQMVSQPICVDLDPNFYNADQQENLAWIFGMQEFNDKQGYTSKPKPIYSVNLSGDGAWAQNSQIIKDLDLQYAAKMIGAKDETEFDAMWNEYQASLESMGKFSTVKAEFVNAYEATMK